VNLFNVLLNISTSYAIFRRWLRAARLIRFLPKAYPFGSPIYVARIPAAPLIRFLPKAYPFGSPIYVARIPAAPLIRFLPKAHPFGSPIYVARIPAAPLSIFETCWRSVFLTSRRRPVRF
jgi:hypothetical protein